MQLTVISKNSPVERLSDENLTVVFDAGMGNWSLFFRPLVSILQNYSAICLVDRTGYDTESPCLAGQDAESVARQLKTQLDMRRIQGKLILAGHSIGGIHMRMFQKLYPNEVAGIILIDSAHPDLFEYIPELNALLEDQRSKISSVINLARMGTLHFAKRKIPTFGLPCILHKEYFKQVTRQKYYHTYRREIETLGQTIHQSTSLPERIDIPVLVVASTAGLIEDKTNPAWIDHSRNWRRMQRNHYKLSSHCTYMECYGGHFPHITCTQQVADAIISFIKPIQYAQAS